MKKIIYLSIISLLFALRSVAQSPTSPAQGFNVFTLNGATLITNETEGPVAIGGDLTLTSNGSYQVSTNQTGSFQVSGVTVTLLVGGKIVYSGGNGLSINSNGYVKIGDSTNSYVWYKDNNNAYSPIRITPGNNYNGSPRLNLSISANNAVFGANPASSSNNPIFQSNLINFSTAFTTMQASSTSIGSCADNAYLTDANGNVIAHTNLPTQVKITLNTGINTLNLTGTDMNNVQNFTFNNAPDATHILVINVNASGTFNWSAWTDGGVSQSNCPYILYNFYNTTTLNIQGNGTVEGTVFAPYADITKSVNQANIEGQVIGLSYYHSGGENHYANFIPTVTGCSTPTVASFTINNNSQCLSGNSFLFTSTSTGSSLTYSWNFGDNTTSTASSFTKTYAAAGTYTVKLKVTGTGGSDSITHNVTVTANVTPSVSINANPGTTICSGTSVTFTATPTNGGSTPSYQWKLNGTNVGTNSTTYTNASLNNNDVVSVVMTSNATCASPATATSTVTMTVNSVTPSVVISGTTTICTGTSVTFTATPTNGGSAPSYQWKLNGVNVGTNSTTYTNSSLANTNTITCVMTSNATCASPTTATSNTLTMSVSSNLTPSVSIAANPGISICSGTSVIFTATPTNGGTAPSYQWKLNNVNVGTNSATYTNASLNNNDVVSVVMTSNASCASPATATNSVTMTVNHVTPSVSISGNNTSCAGISVTFTATPTNGGSTPSYQWKVNGTNVGTNSTTYSSSSLNNADVVSCVMTSNATCASPATATSNTITMTINPQPAEPGAFTVSSATTYQGQTSVTYTVPSVAGVTYTWSYSGTGVTISGSGNSVTLSFNATATSGSLCVTASTSLGCGPSASRCMPITVKPYETWTCGTSTDWNTATNWDGGFVPYSTISVLIPSGVCNPNICSVNASANNVTINSGATVTICCAYELDVKGNFTNNGTVSGCGYVVVTDSCHTLYGKGKVDNFELRSGCSVCNTVINSGDTLHIGKTFKPTSGTLLTNGGLELLSDSGGTAVVLAHGNTCGNCNTYISGEVICDKYVHGGVRAFRFLGHPFTSSIGLNQLTTYMDITGQGGSANGFTTTVTNNPSAFWYNTLTANGSSVNDSTGWIPFTNTNGAGANAWNRFEGLRLLFRGSLGQGLGCSLCVPDPITIKMHGQVNECDQVVSCATNTNVGYNFIGNPYPSNIDLSLCTRGSSVGANFSVWDPNQGTYGAYVSQPFSFSYILPSMSAFFTTCSSSSNNTITFHESDKTASAASGNLFKTTSGFGNNVVQLHILSNNDSLSWDRLLLFFNGQAMATLDNLDNQKIYNPGASLYSFSTDASQLSVDVRPYVDGQVIQLGLQNADAMDYTIRVDDYDVPAGATLYLHDKYLNQVQALSYGMEYHFSVSSDPNSQGDNRFELNLSGATSVNNVVAGNDFKVNMMPNPASNSAIVSFEAPQSGNTVVHVSAITGQVLYSSELGDVKSGKAVLPLQNFAPGMYIVNVVCGNYSVTQRLVKQ